MTGIGVSNDSQKQTLLLHVADMDVQEIYFTIASDGGDVSFEATLQELDHFFLFPSRTFLLRDIYLDKFRRRAEKLWTSLCVDYVSEQRLVSLALTRTSTSAINS